uniref:Proteasome assembly chaperone 2 n=1 Tax=Gadus morhua TaxID=8049 RepID=A0A8C5C2T6_GADMO
AKRFVCFQPAIAVGNVAQLAVDLIVSTLSMKRVGYMHTDCLVPMVGPNPYATSAEDAGEIHTTAEGICHNFFYRSRSVLNMQKKSWFVLTSEFSRTVVLSSSHAYQRDDQQLKGTPLRYLVTPAMRTASGPALTELGWMEMERLSPFPGLVEAVPRLSIPGGGVTKGLFTDGCQEELCLAVVLVFCSEGDNVPDAFTLVNHLNEWLLLKRGAQKWKVPGSWRLLFGSSHPPSIF